MYTCMYSVEYRVEIQLKVSIKRGTHSSEECVLRGVQGSSIVGVHFLRDPNDREQSTAAGDTCAGTGIQTVRFAAFGNSVQCSLIRIFGIREPACLPPYFSPPFPIL